MTIATIYAIVTIVPSILLLIMVLLGGDTDIDTDVDIDADIDMDVDMDMDVDADADLDLDADADVDVGVAGPGYFGLKLVFGFIIGFGLGGFLAVKNEWPIPHYLCGLAGGAVIYFIEYHLLKLLYAQQANTQTRATSVVGQVAVVTHAIGKGGMGEIRVVTPRTGQSLFLRARAIDAEAELAEGAEVRIKSVSTGLARVEPKQD